MIINYRAYIFDIGPLTYIIYIFFHDTYSTIRVYGRLEYVRKIYQQNKSGKNIEKDLKNIMISIVQVPVLNKKRPTMKANQNGKVLQLNAARPLASRHRLALASVFIVPLFATNAKSLTPTRTHTHTHARSPFICADLIDGRPEKDRAECLQI